MSTKKERERCALPNEKLLKVSELAEFLGLKKLPVYDLIPKGEPKAVRIGKISVRIPGSEMSKVIGKREVQR